jgi:hypothetical protein
MGISRTALVGTILLTLANGAVARAAEVQISDLFTNLPKFVQRNMTNNYPETPDFLEGNGLVAGPFGHECRVYMDPTAYSSFARRPGYVEFCLHIRATLWEQMNNKGGTRGCVGPLLPHETVIVEKSLNLHGRKTVVISSRDQNSTMTLREDAGGFVAVFSSSSQPDLTCRVR